MAQQPMVKPTIKICRDVVYASKNDSGDTVEEWKNHPVKVDGVWVGLNGEEPQSWPDSRVKIGPHPGMCAEAVTGVVEVNGGCAGILFIPVEAVEEFSKSMGIETGE